ncbi:DUF799 family lipoprotein [bacterium]|nr:DUF799 family lipoprotein [bacterium]MBU3929495.1 DUF799 family lipoprotein [bacterium]MBU4122334.1 DUF799 family lipoprotein [bacterium]
MIKRIILLIGIAVFFSSCAAVHKPILLHNNFTRPIKVAVLPFANETSDLTAGELFRELFYYGLKEKDYELIPMEVIDKKLNAIGITDGGQLPSIGQDELIKELGVSGLIYGTLKKCQYLTTGIYKKKEVIGNIKVYKNGDLYWEDEITVTKKEFGLNPIKGLQEQVTNKFFEGAFKKYAGHPLYAHIENMVYQLQATMPGKREEVSGW